MFTRTLSRIVGIGALGAVAMAANAAVTAYEGFDGSPTGFATNFTAPNADSGSQVAGLNYGPLVTNGFARQGGAAWANRGVLPEYVNSGVQWMSWLYHTSATPSTWNRLLTAINGDISGNNERYNLGYTGDGFTVRGVYGTTKPSANWQTTLTADTTYMLAAKYDFSAASITLWVNPDLSSLGTGSAPTGGHEISASGISLDAMNFNAVGFYANPNGGGASTFDELRLGSSWIDVSPTVPEPAAIGIVAGAGLLALRRRRA